MTTWTPDSWRAKPISQVPAYPDGAKLVEAERQLSTFPPLVFAGEARDLKTRLAAVSRGEAFLLPRLPANAFRADPRCQQACGQGRPRRWPVRQASLCRYRNHRRRRAAQL